MLGTWSVGKVDSDELDLPWSRLVQELNVEVKFAMAAANLADFSINIGASVAGAWNEGEICRCGGKFNDFINHISIYIFSSRMQSIRMSAAFWIYFMRKTMYMHTSAMIRSTNSKSLPKASLRAPYNGERCFGALPFERTIYGGWLFPL